MAKTTIKPSSSEKKSKKVVSEVPVPVPVLEPEPVPEPVPVSAPAPVSEPIKISIEEVMDNPSVEGKVLKEKKIKKINNNEENQKTEINIELLTEQVSDLSEKLKSTIDELVGIYGKLKLHKKDIPKLKRIVNKGKKGKSDTDVKRISGFKIPRPVSVELAKFLGLGEKELIARADVTHKISEYVGKHKLGKPGNGRFIVPDKTLADLFGLTEEQQKDFGYFNLQRYIAKHIPKTGKK